MNDSVIPLHLSAIAITLPRPIEYKYHTLKHLHVKHLIISLTIMLNLRYQHALLCIKNEH